jgi:hypothetical protein
MEQTTKRRATSTPKAAAVATETPAKQVKKSAPIKRKVEAPTSRVYQTVEGGGIVHMIQSKGITIFDEENGQVREMRYCPNEPSIWRDEQSDSARKEAVVFRNGTLIVPRTKPNLMEYLDSHHHCKRQVYRRALASGNLLRYEHRPQRFRDQV